MKSVEIGETIRQAVDRLAGLVSEDWENTPLQPDISAEWQVTNDNRVKKTKLKEKTQLMSVKSIMAYECIKSEVSQEEAVSANHAKLYET